MDIGFKEIEVDSPAASETEYQFMRTLIEKNMIPDDDGTGTYAGERAYYQEDL